MSKFYKLALTLALSLVLMMALACGVSVHEEDCDHDWIVYDTKVSYDRIDCIKFSTSTSLIMRLTIR